MKQKRRKVKWDLLPAMLLFMAFPAMAKGMCVDTGMENYSWSPVGEQVYDFFMKIKSLCFLGLVVWMAVILADRILIRQKIKFHGKKCLLLAVYALLVVLSAVFSVNKTLSFSGMAEQYETVWVLLGYVVTCFYCAQVTESKQDLYLLLKCLCVGAVLQGILGVMQAAGIDFWNTVLGKNILTLGLDGISGKDLVFQFADTKTNKVYMTLYNPNYAGVYIVMLLPLMLVCIFRTSDRISWKMAAGLAASLLVICLVASGSKTGWIILGLLNVVGVWMLVNPLKKRCIGLVLSLVFVAAAVGVYDFVGGHSLWKALKKSVHKQEYALTKLNPVQDGVEVCFRGETFLISSEQEEADYQGLEVSVFTENEMDYILIEWNDIQWEFVKTKQNETYMYINPYGKTDEICEAKNLLPGYERALSCRGYIWGRAAVLLKETIVLGKGPDTFTVIFPQQDYLMRANASKGLFSQIRSKAHNMYLQIALQTGVISLVCFLVFGGIVLVNLYKKRKQDPVLYTGMFLGILAYLMMGMMNDSVVAVAPLFWGILGMGLAMERINDEA